MPLCLQLASKASSTCSLARHRPWNVSGSTLQVCSSTARGGNEAMAVPSTIYFATGNKKKLEEVTKVLCVV